APVLGRARQGIRPQGPAAVDKAAREEAWRWIRENPGRAAHLYFKKLWIILSDDTSVAGWALYGRGIAPPEPAIDVLQGPHFARSHEAAVRRLLRIFDVLLLSCAAAGLILLFLRAKRSRSLVDRALAVGMLTAIAYVPILSAAI